MHLSPTRLSAAALLLMAFPAQAAMPEPVRAMIDAAMADGKDADVEMVMKLARQTNPADAAEIDALLADYRIKRAQASAESKAIERTKLAKAGLLENWHGEGQIGASHSRGNSNSTGVSAGVKLARTGIDWTYKFRALADYQRRNGVTTTEQWLAEIEPQYRISDRAFAFGLGRYERDRFQGFGRRLTASGGLGYQVIDRDALKLAVKAGPAFRTTHFVGGGIDSQLTGLAGLDFDWQLSPQLRLTETASTLVGRGNMSFSSLTAVSAKFSDALSARIGYSVDIDTNPPPGAKMTDTLTRFTLVYGF